MDSHSYLLHCNEKIIRENEYLRLIWSSIFEQLFLPNGIVYVITGEGENAYSTESKKEQYPQAKSVHGFKIDIRLVVEIEEEEIDVAVVECAKKSDDNKAIKDNAKLLRECKDTIDGLVNNLKNTNDEAMSYMIQITGFSCALSTMHLAVNEVSFNRQKMPVINDKLIWLRCTWYTPPRDQISAVPLLCFGPPPPTPIFTDETNTLAE
ncbi:hypothetical protein G6F46_003713 [Rhizopus delemar]|uniref:Uncharacterized protein n=2 Tax=Rhizopus TaxID=4842 RepID=A0A9P6ZCA1_9FUNG|nr:hypothetical protein G6F55_001107 [Rhizopus delemar]KAG1547777.1 hypothetical protein G6F51_004057 [Rhizopus arrhizus]KAG1504078.1 hypothetical protein G6F54_001239 [Rhizopus delemar]KAG1517794.1 hypothetical protein G6F53_001080 [Rhizopus delemar]KAG1521084.1 hypothetical protein G6F52_007062 [Rhizopus delemar]